MATLTPALPDVLTSQVPLETYLSTTYRPDREWITGEVKERNLGEAQHSEIQKFLIRILSNHERAFGVRVRPEQRVQTSAEHFRIPDLCLIRRDLPFEPIVRTAPVLCVEILSRDDSMTDMTERVDDYLNMGVPVVWLVDPRRRRAFMIDASGAMQPATASLEVPGTEIRISLPEMWSELDEAEGVQA